MLMMKCVSAWRIHFLLVMAILGHGAYAHAGAVEITNVFWHFDQGGYVQTDPSNFDIYQATYGPNLPENVVEGELGGASFLSTATMDTFMMQTSKLTQFSAIGEFTVEASVDANTPEGLAQAYASFIGFGVTFSVNGGEFLYTGTEPLVNNDGVGYGSGSTLQPGVYSFKCFTCNSFVDTGFVGPGETVVTSLVREFHFEFTTIPTPGALASVLVALTLRRRRRRR